MQPYVFDAALHELIVFRFCARFLARTGAIRDREWPIHDGIDSENTPHFAWGAERGGDWGAGFARAVRLAHSSSRGVHVILNSK